LFRRSETARERVLLRIIEKQQDQITDLTDRVMFLSQRPWALPPADTFHSAEFERPDWTYAPEQEPLH
jgi:hypothetical protein